ncbi:MAG: glycosyltransferase family 2 protein [Hyphomicrobiales bacterium]|nr:glycosyltransferase family 2 protein [Hyphomicrobiales bacterium]
MKLSVLINNYNYAQYLGPCIDSALLQDYPDFEVVVVDDGSTDNSRELIASYGDRIVPVLKPNGGQASSFNAGFAAASGDIILFLDADDAFLPRKLSQIAKAYADTPIDWCFDRVTTDERTTPPAEVVITPFDKRDRLRRGKFPSLPVPTSGLSFRREALAKILPMPVAGDVVLSDNYLKFAAAYLGAGAVIETPLTFQRIHASNRYTGVQAKGSLRPRIMVETGLELARRYGGLRALGKSLVAGGLAEGKLPLSGVWGEIRRCTRDGTFGADGAAQIAALVAYKRLANRLRPKHGASS